MLNDLGWDDDWQAAFAPFTTDGLVPARVSLEHNHVYRVLGSTGEWLAEATGRMKFRATGRDALPAVGDWVAARPGGAGARAQIVHVLPRRTWFSRKAAGRDTTEQVVAANVDQVFLVFGLDLGVNVRAIERYLVVARRSRVAPVVVLNKTDVVADVAGRVAEAAASADGAPVIAVSAVQAIGLETLESFLTRGRTVALLGPSGAGKSSLVNRLVGRAQLPTGGVREWDARGRHTSVHRQLVVREQGGLIIDTPGMRELQLWESDAADDAFGEIADLAAACRFRDCRHDREPGCAVKAGVDAGLIPTARYQSFLKLQSEREDVERKRDERALAEAKRLGRVGARAMRALQNERDRKQP